MTLKEVYPSGKSKNRYFANEDGVTEEYDYLDENGEVMWTMRNMILPKEAFVAAYKKYIEEDE